MKILLVSDICWETYLDIRTGQPTCWHSSGKNIISENISSPKFIEEKILKINPSLILFAGDIISDGSCHLNHTDDLLKLLKSINKNKIYSFLIQGNHDDDIEYKNLLIDSESLQYIKDISGKLEDFNGIKILGIPFSFTHNLKKSRNIENIFPENVDIVLAHSEYVRRIWLLGLKSKFIITGHFDDQLCQIFGKVFIASGGFPLNYVTIDYEIDKQIITYFKIPLVLHSHDQMVQECGYKAILTNGNLLWKAIGEEDDFIKHLKQMDMPI